MTRLGQGAGKRVRHSAPGRLAAATRLFRRTCAHYEVMSCNAPSAGGGPRLSSRQAIRDEPSSSVEAQAPAHLVFVHDRVGVAMRDAGVIRQPVGALVAAQERGAGFKPVEPLSEVTSGNDRDTRNETTVQIR
jgi:hypothetical protein